MKGFPVTVRPPSSAPKYRYATLNYRLDHAAEDILEFTECFRGWRLAFVVESAAVVIFEQVFE